MHEPRKTASTVMSRIGVPARRSMYFSARPAASRSAGSRASGSGTRPSIVTVCDGLVPHDTYGRSSDASMRTSRSKRRAVVGRKRAPLVERALPVLALGRVLALLDVRVRRLVRRDHSRARARLDRHVADGHAAFHRERADRGAAVLDDLADAAAHADARDDPEDHVLRPHAARQVAFDRDRHGPGTRWPTASASRGRARPRSCRSRTRSRRTRRASRCGCRRTRSSCPAR